MNEGYTKPFVTNSKPDYSVKFQNPSGDVYKLDFNGSKLIFTGEAEESAKMFVEWAAWLWEARLKDERAAEREACAKYVAESFGKELVDGQDVAAAIRARGSDGISN